MRTLKKSLQFTLIIILFSQCEKMDFDNENVAINAAGYITYQSVAVASWSFSGKYPAIWINGEPKILEKQMGHANSLYIINSDVYVAGQVYDGIWDDCKVAKLWKNGSGTLLTDSTTYSEAKSVFVSGSDVYVCGYVYDSSENQIAVIWKNGIETKLTDGSSKAEANSVYVADGDVYVAGYENSKAIIWKNGVATEFTDGTKGSALASSVYVTNEGNVFIAGYGHDDGEHWNIYSYAKLWKNGVVNNLSDGEQVNWASSVFVSNANVYIAGGEFNYSEYGTNCIAKMWINGIETILSNNSHEARANSIYVSSENVYVGGWEYDTVTSLNVARIWKNGAIFELYDATTDLIRNDTLFILTDGTAITINDGSVESYINSIFVEN